MSALFVGESADTNDDRVTVECGSFHGFLGSFVPWATGEGIFIPTGAPRAVGSCVEFTVGLGADFPLLKGFGEVAWVVDPGTAGDWPSGMAIRYVLLDPSTEVLIEKMREHGRNENIRTMLSIDEPPAAARLESELETVESPPAPSATDASAGGPMATEAGSAALSWAASVLVGLALGGVGYWLQGATSRTARAVTETPVVVAEPARTVGSEREVLAAAGAMEFLDREPSLPETTRADRAASIESIEWVTESDSTLVVLTADAPWGPDGYQTLRVEGGAPRVVLKIAGVGMPPYTRFEVGSAHVVRLRLGLHGDGAARELHVVADLADARVALAGVEVREAELRLRFEQDGR